MSDVPAVAAKPARVLVADDEEDVRFLVSRVLSDAGFEVQSVPGGREAIEAVAASRPDLLVLDLMMPDVDGWAVMQHLGGLSSPPPIVILSARADYESFTRGVGEGGATAFVSKPFRIEDLVDTCRRVITLANTPPAEVENERRREARRHLVAAVTVLSREKKPVALGELVNLSSGGAQVELGVPLEPGSHVWVAFHAGAIRLTIECRVQWWQGSASRSIVHGLSFLSVAPDQEEPIRRLLTPRAG